MHAVGANPIESASNFLHAILNRYGDNMQTTGMEAFPSWPNWLPSLLLILFAIQPEEEF